MNAWRTGILLGVLTVVLILAGGAIGGRQGAVVACVLAAVLNLGSYWFSDKIVLAAYRAHPISEADNPRLHQMVRELSQRARLPMPRLYRIPARQPNAFATGRDPEHAVVAVTDGILTALEPDELRGVLAHELGHVRHRDILIGSIAATIAGAITLLASWARWAAIFGGMRRSDDDDAGGLIGLVALAILAPLAALVIQLAISRTREYEADRGAAQLAGSPTGLARALAKLEAYASRQPMPGAKAASAHLFIVNPIRGGTLSTLFSTHPPIRERIRRLEAMRVA